MKILFVIESLAVGGAERVVVNLANYFKKNKDEPVILTLRPENNFKEELNGIKVISLHKKRVFDPPFISSLKREIKSIDPDIINAHLFTSALWARIALLGMKNKPPVFITYHNVLWNEKWYTPLHKALNKWLHKRAKGHIFVSQDVRDFYKKAEKLCGTVIYNGIDTERFAFSSGREDGTKLLFVGRLIERKGVDDLFPIYKGLSKGHRLTICGLGPMEESVRKRLLKGMDFTFSQKTYELYATHDILLLPSYWEGFALVVLEAISSGLPVIAYHSPGLIDHPLKDFISFVELGDIEGFIDKINNYRYNKEMAERGRRLIEENFSITAMGNNYKKIFLK